MKLQRFIIVIFIGFLTLSACDNKQPRLDLLPYNATIVAFGDSITHGAGASETDSYPSVLSKLIGFKVINAGVSGNTTIDGLRRLPQVLAEYKPDLVLLCLGGNDMLRRFNEKKTKNNLIQLVRLIKASQAQVVLIAVPEPRILLSPPDFYEEIGEEENIPVMPNLLTKLYKNTAYKSDRIHLNKAGYEKMAEGIAEFLRKQGAV